MLYINRGLYMKKELHLFIIWKNALDIKNKIIKDIKETFNIRNQFMKNCIQTGRRTGGMYQRHLFLQKTIIMPMKL